MKFFVPLLSIFIIFLMALLVSNNRRKIPYSRLFVMLIVQFVLAYILLNSAFGVTFINALTKGFNTLLSFAREGVVFVFGDLAAQHQFIFFFNVLLPIIFVSALIGILRYIGVLNLIMRAISTLLTFINGMGKLESYNGVASFILGQSEVFISLKKQLGYIDNVRLYTLCASAMSTVSLAIVGAYMQIIEPRFVVTALMLNLFGSFMISSIVNPYQLTTEENVLEVEDPRQLSFFEMLGEYILDGFKVALIVAAMLIGYISLIAMLNAISSGLTGTDLQTWLGYLFSPFALLIGVSPHDMVVSGNLMATKIVSNEFVAMVQLSHQTTLSARSIGIISVFLVSFANFGSIGVIIGAINVLSPTKAKIVSRFSLKLLYGATLVSLLSATLASIFL